MIFSLHFVLWLTLMKHQSVTLRQNIDTHLMFSCELFSFTLGHKLFKWIISKPTVFTYFVCIWLFGRARSSKCTLLVSFRAHHAGTHTHTHTFQPGEQCLSCGLYIQRFIIKHIQQFRNCKDSILQQSPVELILTLSFGQGGTFAHRCEGKEVVVEETRL